jgi:hypothetical protein
MSARYAFPILFTLLTLNGCGPAETPDENTDVNPTTSESTVTVEETAPSYPETSRDSAFVVAEESNDTANEEVVTEELELGNPGPSADHDTTPEATLEKADVGAGKKGRGYGGGPISEPAKQYFAIRERTVFQIQIPQALKMYEAVNGKLPTSHEEFMSKVLKENNITLPELPEGKSYVYDPENGELMIQSGE